MALACDRIHWALRPKPPSDKPTCDVILCMKDYLIKEEVLQALRNTANIELDSVKIQIFPDISQATLVRRCKMKEVTSVLQLDTFGYHHRCLSRSALVYTWQTNY